MLVCQEVLPLYDWDEESLREYAKSSDVIDLSVYRTMYHQVYSSQGICPCCQLPDEPVEEDNVVVLYP